MTSDDATDTVSDTPSTGDHGSLSAAQFAALADGLYDRIVRSVYAYCRDRTTAEDSAQEALVRAWERVDDGEELRSIEAWTMTVAFNWCRSRMRNRSAGRRALGRLRRRNDDTMATPTDMVDRQVEARSLSDELARAVQALPDRQRQVVVLHYLADMDLASIAEVAGISTGAAKNALFNGRNALRETLGRTQEQEPTGTHDRGSR